MLVNGSFESFQIAPNTWKQVGHRNIAGWSSLNGQPIELWGNGFNGVNAVDGAVFVELDARDAKADAIYQDIQTENGSVYELSFYLRSRSNQFDSTSESVRVIWDGASVVKTTHHAEAAKTWTKIVVSVTGSGGMDRLTLREMTTDGGNDGRGVLLDNIELSLACPSGQTLDGSGFCVASWCTANYQCPNNAERLNGRECYDTIDDCLCLDGFSKSGTECVSDTSPCDAQQKLDGSGYCVEEWCSSDYSCPTSAIRKEGRQCYDTIDDCECLAGFSMTSGMCIEESACEPGYHLDGSGYCVADGCTADFQCPSGMTRIPSREECYDTINDCT